MTFLRNAVLAMLLCIIWSGTVLAAQGNFIKKVNNYDYFIDYSGSMMLTHKILGKEKMEIAKQVLTNINKTIPELDYQAGLLSVAPYGIISNHSLWNRAKMVGAIDSLSTTLDVFGRRTDLGDGFLDYAKQVAPYQGKTALILVSDGEVNTGPDPISSVKALLGANPNLCVHIISIADTPEGEETLNNIAKVNPCSIKVHAGELLSNDAKLKKFVKDVFYDDIIEDIIVLRGVNFAFNSSQLAPEAQGILNEAAKILVKDTKAKILLNGYTDYIGSDAYNMALSQRRADAVKTYLVSRGVHAMRIMAIGKGKSYTYDNKTEEGRYMNRRVEIVLE